MVEEQENEEIEGELRFSNELNFIQEEEEGKHPFYSSSIVSLTGKVKNLEDYSPNDYPWMKWMHATALTGFFFLFGNCIRDLLEEM